MYAGPRPPPRPSATDNTTSRRPHHLTDVTRGSTLLLLDRARRRFAVTARVARAARGVTGVLSLRVVPLVGVFLVCALALAGAFAAVVTSATPASAHASLVKAVPADGAVLTSAPARVTLQFDDPISSSFATLVVTGPDGHNVATGKPSVAGSSLTGDLSDELAPGTYRTVFRVVSDDGHPVEGQLTFTLRRSSGSTPTTSPSPGPPSASADPGATSAGRTSSAGGSSWVADNMLPLTATLLLAVIGAGALLWDRLRH
jgi:methionine-rich copper-binding protein CopC